MSISSTTERESKNAERRLYGETNIDEIIPEPLNSLCARRPPPTLWRKSALKCSDFFFERVCYLVTRVLHTTLFHNIINDVTVIVEPNDYYILRQGETSYTGCLCSCTFFCSGPGGWVHVESIDHGGGWRVDRLLCAVFCCFIELLGGMYSSRVDKRFVVRSADVVVDVSMSCFFS